MDKDTFYQDHWRTIEDERLARYEQMFVYRPTHDPMLAPLGVEPGHTVIDYGCGPGFLAMEFARRVGDQGKAFGLDINSQFLSRATSRAREAGLSNLSFVELTEDGASLPDSVADRLFCKNVLEYVPDALTTLTEQRRLLKPGGRIEIVDSDWGFVIVEPWGESLTREFFAAAAPAFREPHIGRKLFGLLQAAGFHDVNVQVSALPDPVGGTLAVVRNMASYIETFNTMPTEVVTGHLARLEQAVERGEYLFILPQFIVTATNP